MGNHVDKLVFYMPPAGEAPIISSRELQALGRDARLRPAKYVPLYLKGQKNDYRDAEAIAEHKAAIGLATAFPWTFISARFHSGV
jgi:transposase